MRIVLLIPKLHAAADLALNKLLQRKDLDIVGIVRSDISPFKKRYWKYLSYGVRRAGIFYGAMIALTSYLHWIGLGIASLLIWRRRRKWMFVYQLRKKYGFKIHDTENVNSVESIEVLKSWEPDVIVTVYFDQILKRAVIDIPKVAALNMHPGLLPRYKGLWPEFWKLHNGEKFAGVSVHHLNEKIDDGDVIGQVKFPIKEGDTKWGLSMKSAQKGAALLIQILGKIKRGVKLPAMKFKAKPRYYSFPKKVHFDAFYARGRRLFSLMGLWRQVKRLF